MKNLIINLTLCVMMLSLNSCKKSNDDEKSCVYGGVYEADKYVFWIDHDFGCGPITVTITSGQSVPTLGTTIKMYDTFQPTCSDNEYLNRAGFLLNPGERYTYHAACSGKEWNGTIDVPCEFGQCYAIQLR